MLICNITVTWWEDCTTTCSIDKVDGSETPYEVECADLWSRSVDHVSFVSFDEALEYVFGNMGIRAGTVDVEPPSINYPDGTQVGPEIV